VRLGTAGVTTRGMKEAQMRQIAAMMDAVLSDVTDKARQAKVKKEVAALARNSQSIK